MLVTGSLDGRVKLWDVSTLPNGQSSINNFTSLGEDFSPDGRLNARSENGQVVIRRTATEETIATLAVHRAAFSPDGKVLAAVSGVQGFSIWDAHSFLRLAEIPSDLVLDDPVEFSPDGRWLMLNHLSAEQPRVVEIRETSQWRFHAIWKPDYKQDSSGQSGRFMFSDDGRFLAGQCREGSVCVFDVPARRAARFPVRDNLKAKCVAWVPRSHTVCIGSLDGRVHLWNLDTDQTEVLTPEAGNVWAIAVSPDAKTLAVGTQDGVLKLFNLPTWREVAVLKGHLTYIGGLTFSPDGGVLISSGGGSSRIWRARDVIEKTDGWNR